MFNNKLSITVLSLLTAVIFLTSCEWEQPEPIDTMPENVSFTADIMPIFNASCNTVGCHNNGGISPDLSEGNAYSSLQSPTMINTTTPENSELYVRMIDIQSPMPIAGLLSETTTNKVLIWITEGAEDN